MIHEYVEQMSRYKGYEFGRPGQARPGLSSSGQTLMKALAGEL